MDVKTICLGLLTLDDATGYDLKKQLEGSFNHFYSAGFGSIYPALAQLAEAGLVECSEVSEEGRPARKLYRITGRGREAFLDTLKNNSSPGHKLRSEFLAMMYFAQLMDPGQIRAILDHRLEELDRKLDLLAEYEQSDWRHWPAGPRFVCGFGKAVMQAARDYVAENRQLLSDGKELAKEPRGDKVVTRNGRVQA